MKPIIPLILLVLVIDLTNSAYAQNPPADKMVMITGEEKLGKVTEIGDTYVKFIHANETLVYTLQKKDINKIQFSSGRVEFITEAKPAGEEGGTGLQAHHNLVAVIPFTYIQRGGSRDEKLGLKVQSDCYNVLKKYASQFTLQDPMTTNALLVKNNITSESIIGFTPIELAHILGVEYIILGTVTVNEKGVTTSSGSYYEEKNKGKKSTGIILGSSSTTVEFSTAVDMKIYSDQGQNIFAQSHDSFWQTEDAYQITLQYLIKRSPLYNK
jgi:hypothetical protein